VADQLHDQVALPLRKEPSAPMDYGILFGPRTGENLAKSRENSSAKDRTLVAHFVA